MATTPNLNTKYFHISNILRRRQNSIVAIKAENGEWLHEREAIGFHIVNHLKTLFSRSNNRFPRGLHGLIPELINDEDNSMLCTMPDDFEVWQVDRSIGPTKAPGPDGFTATFYQKYWQVVKIDVVKMVCSFFEVCRCFVK